MNPSIPRQTSLVLAALTLAGLSPTNAAVRYWDPSGSGNFGTINNTTVWVSPLNIVWTGSPNGQTARLQNYTTTLSDDCNWGGPLPPASPTNPLGGGTVPVGTVNAGTLSFNYISGSGTVTLSGGTITLKDATSITAWVYGVANTHTISSTLAGAATSLTKLGDGTIILSGSNVYAGSTIISAGTLTLGNSNALANSPLDTTNSIAGTAASGLKTTVTSLTFGGLTGDKDLASLFTTTSSGFGSVTGITLNPGDAVTTSYSGVIADGAAGMALTKGGLGTQVLSGANSYTGATTVNAGILRLDYSTQDNSKLSDTGTLVLGNGTLELAGGSHTEVVASTTLTGNAKVTRSSGSTVLALGAVSGTGSIDLSADNIATTTTPNNALGLLPFATIGGSNLAANDGTGKIVTFTGYLDIAARGPSTVPDNVNAIVRIVGDGTSGNIDLAASTTSIYSLLQSNPNFAATIDSAGKTFASNSITVGAGAESLNIGVAAGDGTLRSPAAGGTLALTSGNAAKSLVVNAGIVDNTTPSAVSTAGAGTVVLAGTNTYTGATVVGDGTLQLSGSLAGTTVSVVGDAVLKQTSSGAISGAVTVTHDSIGVSTLAGANSYTGITAINAGSITIGNSAALGDAAAGTTVANGAALQIENDITVGAEALTLQGTGIGGSGALRNLGGSNTCGGPVTLAGPTLITAEAGTLTLSNPGSLAGATFTLSVGGAGNTAIHSTIDTTTGSLAKTGAGTLTLTGANTFTGDVNITGGAVNIRNDGALGTSAGGVVVGNGAALQLEGGITVGAEALTMVGSGVSNSGALRNISGDNTWGGAITLSTTTRIQSDAGTLTLDVASGNTIAGTGPAAGGGANPPVIFGGDGNITVADPIASGNTRTGTITKQGAGTLAFLAANTYTGNTVVSAGLLSLENSLALQNSALDTGASVAGDGANGLRTTVTELTVGGLVGDKNLADLFTTAAGGFDSVTALTFNTPSGAAHSYSGGIANGAAGMSVTKNNAGTQVLSGASGFSGDLTVNGGVLVANASTPDNTAPATALGNATSATRTITVNTGGTLRFDAGNVLSHNFSSNTVPSLVIAGGTLTNGGAATNNALGKLTLAGGTLSATLASVEGYGSWNLNGTVTSTGASVISSNASAPIALSANTSGNGNVTTFDVQSDTLTVSAALGQVTAAGDERVSGLTKTGIGTLVLSGDNSYTGTTGVDAGTLALVGCSLASPVTVAGGASLGFTLGSPATSTAAVTLTTGSKIKVTGTPDGLSNYTLLTASSITGTPELDAPIENYKLVVEGGTTLVLRFATGGDYGTWAAKFPGADLTDPNADYDRDGMSNDQERIFGLDPTKGNSVNPFPVPLNPATGTFSFTRRDPALSKLLYTIWTSTDLQGWTKDTGAVLTPGAVVDEVQTVAVQLSAALLASPRLFVRVMAEESGPPPPLLSASFEDNDGGFTVAQLGTGTLWAWGDPESPTQGGGAVTTGSGGSAKCWGTNLIGTYAAGTDTALRSPVIDLTGVTGATLTFARAIDAVAGHTLEVNVIDDTTDTVIANVVPATGDADTNNAPWETVGPLAIPAGALGQPVRLEWRFRALTGDGTYLGVYLDNVVVTQTAP